MQRDCLPHSLRKLHPVVRCSVIKVYGLSNQLEIKSSGSRIIEGSQVGRPVGAIPRTGRHIGAR